MSEVLFGSARARMLSREDSLPVKLDVMLDKLGITGDLNDKRVCVKMHLGGGVGYSTVHPLFVRRLVAFIKEAGGHPFVTEIGPFVSTAYERGYTREVLGCPIVSATGIADKYVYTYPSAYKNFREFRIGGEIWDSDYLVCLSHAKGHGCSGYGGAIKNIAIGAMDSQTRQDMHMVQHAESYWDAEKCTHFTDGCTICVDNCVRQTSRFADDNLLHVGFHECDFCQLCNEACPTGALTVSDVIAEDFQYLLGLGAQAVMSRFPDGKAVFINFATDITQFCDCCGVTTPSLVPDIGIFVSKDLVAVEQATLDAIDYRNLIPGSVIENMPMRDIEGHLFKRLHGKDPYVQVRACEELGLGTSAYELEEV